jgi:hypothetical protein
VERGLGQVFFVEKRARMRRKRERENLLGHENGERSTRSRRAAGVNPGCPRPVVRGSSR